MSGARSHRTPNRLFLAALLLSGCGTTRLPKDAKPSGPPAIGADGLIAIDVTGMDPQLAIIRRDAARLGWRITCEGRAGEERVLRLAIPPGADEAVRSYFDPQDHLGSSTRFYSGDDTPPESCDLEPPTTGSSRPSSVLALGPRAELTPLARIARACGFTSAGIRSRRQDDVPAGTPRLQDDWLTLDAGEDAIPRYGPTICFLQMQGRGRGGTRR